MAHDLAREFWVSFRGPFVLFAALVSAPFVIARAFINHDLRTARELFVKRVAN